MDCEWTAADKEGPGGESAAPAPGRALRQRGKLVTMANFDA